MDKTKRAIPNTPKSLGESSLANIIVLTSVNRQSIILMEKT
ncbi:MAG: hypothetical protein ACQEP2_05345 [Actinomycetota bacterium]